MNTLFERVTNGKDEWLTPPEIIKALGRVFDLDPCSPVVRPWDTATHHLTIHDDGLLTPWPENARIWLKPPYGDQCSLWMKKMARHGNGIALTFARTETKMFFESVWPKAQAVLFIKGRLQFYHVSGQSCKMNAGAPSVLIAYGEENSDALSKVTHLGKFIKLM
jgi:hypothetical protein